MPNLALEEFLDYIRAFNDRDIDRQHSYYAKDIQLIIPDPVIGTLHGSDGIKKHYKPIQENADETVIPVVVMIDRSKVFFVMETYFRYWNHVERAVHDYNVVPNDIIKITSWAIYEIDEDKKMKTITCNLFKDELLGQVDVKERIRDSESRADADLRLYNY